MKSISPSPEKRRVRTTLVIIAFALCLVVFMTNLAEPVNAQVEGGEDSLPRYWDVHAWLLTLGTALFVISYLVLWLKFLSRIRGVELPALATEVSKKWYKLHIYFGVAGVALAFAGVVVGYVMVDRAYSGEHLRLAHSYIGVLAGVIVGSPLVTGVVERALKTRKSAMRWWHLAIGFLAMAMMIAGTISGWALE